MWENLITKIKSILTANNEIQEVYDFEVGKFEGQPAAVVVPADSESEYSTSSQNERVYAFSIFLFVQRDEDGQLYDPRKTDEIMRRIVDSVLDDFDKDYTLSGLDLSTGYTMLYLEAAPSAWGYANREKLYRMAEITLRIHMDVNVELIN